MRANILESFTCREQMWHLQKLGGILFRRKIWLGLNLFITTSSGQITKLPAVALLEVYPGFIKFWTK